MRNWRFYLSFLGGLLVILPEAGFAQRSRTDTPARTETRGEVSGYLLQWEGISEEKLSETASMKLLMLKGAQYRLEHHKNPIVFFDVPVNGRPERLNVTLTDMVFEPLTSAEVAALDTDSIAEDITVQTHIGVQRGKFVGRAWFVPIRRNQRSGGFEKLVSYDYTHYVSGTVPVPPRMARTGSSVLSSGDWYRIGVPRDGMYRITYQYLKDIGVNVDGITPDQINIYGNGSGLLPFQNSAFRHDDLQPNAIEVVDGGDGSFDPGDHILFFAKGPHRWRYDDQNDEFRHVKHLYSDTSYYFIGIDAGPPKRVATEPSLQQPPTHQVSVFDDYSFHELDQVNLIKSGRNFFGELFDIQTSYSFSGDRFTFPNIRTDQTAMVRVQAAVRHIQVGGSSSVFVNVAGQASGSFAVSGVSGNYAQSFARMGSTRIDFNPSNPVFNIEVSYQPPSSNSRAWLDFISVNVRRNLVMAGNQMLFRDQQSVGAGNVAQFNLASASSVRRIWDVTDPTTAVAIDYGPDGSSISFARSASQRREYVAITNFNYPTPTFFGTVPNQDLHALVTGQTIDMVIVTHPRFYAEAMELAAYHTHHPVDPVYTEVVTNQQVYNEFSSGIPDITAIKDFMRMFYDNANGNEDLMPKYLLLFGDGSFDNRSRAESNTNFVLTYQTENSTDPIGSFVSDDYFGLLDFNEGEGNNDLVDIGIGRLTVKTRQEAQAVVRKIKNYSTSDFGSEVAHCSGVGANVFGEWRNRVMFIGDNGDNNLHMTHARNLAGIVEQNHPDYNVSLVLLDAYPRITTPGGDRIPEVNRIIREGVDRGMLLVNYSGHGGEVGWAHERILDVSTIRNWTNFNALPLFVTATCEFTRFDDPGRTSAGEFVLLNPDGAGIALLSTTRLVFASANFSLNQAFYDVALENNVFEELRLGDITRVTKVNGPPGANTRSFSLVGDPAVKLVYPQQKIYTTAITDTLGNPLDTLKALGNVKVTGYVGDLNGTMLQDFNGVLTATIFDKASNVTTLAQAGPPFEFSTHQNVIYRGKASVNNGQFSFSFIVPRDINLAVDTTGRFSYYAVGDEYDAHGHAANITVGSIDENAAIDEEGPEIKLFMNDENFVFGGMTDENPVIFAKLFDDSGINMVGTGIGHDITAIKNNDSSNPIILNDFYESDLDTYQSGTVRYQLNDLEEGRYTLNLKAWDVHNNSGEAFTEFVVAESDEFALSHVLNYPNPFTTYTEFFFEHNQVCTFLNVQIQVFTVSGKLVKTINTVSNTNGFRVEPIAWNGLDDYGDQLARGVYVYKVKVRTPSGDRAEKFEKLVILK